jgi:hypothetical protein
MKNRERALVLKSDRRIGMKSGNVIAVCHYLHLFQPTAPRVLDNRAEQLYGDPYPFVEYRDEVYPSYRSVVFKAREIAID